MIMFTGFMASALVLVQALPDASGEAGSRDGVPGESQPAITELAQLPLAQSTAARCGIAFAAVQQWQAADDPRGASWPDMQAASAREFFVRAMAQIMDEHALEREDVSRLVQAEFERHQADKGDAIAAMMPGCLLALEAAKF